MSGLLLNTIIIPNLPPFRAGSTDGRFYNLGPDLTPLSDTVSAIVSIVVVRVDGQTIVPADLTILATPAPYLDATRTIVNWWQTGSLFTKYLLTVTVRTTADRTLVYDCYQTVSAQLG